GNTLRCSVQDIESFRRTVSEKTTLNFLDRLSTRLRRVAARCGCRPTTMRDVQDPSTGTGSTGHEITSQDDDEDLQEEIGPSQLVGASSTQPSPRKRHPLPFRYTPGTDALGKGKG
ncbi:unnamed protein product, partial [Urochloa humidicola]